MSMHELISHIGNSTASKLLLLVSRLERFFPLSFPANRVGPCPLPGLLEATVGLQSADIE